MIVISQSYFRSKNDGLIQPNENERKRMKQQVCYQKIKLEYRFIRIWFAKNNKIRRMRSNVWQLRIVTTIYTIESSIKCCTIVILQNSCLNVRKMKFLMVN